MPHREDKETTSLGRYLRAIPYVWLQQRLQNKTTKAMHMRNKLM